MLSLTTQLAKIRQALTSVSGLNVYHYSAPANVCPYCIWMEQREQGDGLDADNHKASQCLEGTIDYYTKTEDDTNIDSIQTQLVTSGINFFLNSVQYETETELIHYEWYWSIS